MTCSALWQKLSTTRERQISARSAGGTFGRSRVPHSTGAGEAWATESNRLVCSGRSFTLALTIKAVAKEILMRISSEDELQRSEARGQFPEGFSGQSGQNYIGQAIVEGRLQPGVVAAAENKQHRAAGRSWLPLCPAGGESTEQQDRGAWGLQGSGAALPHPLWNWPRPSAPPAQHEPHTKLGEKCICIVCWQNRGTLRRVAEHGTVRKRRGRTEEFHPADKTKPNPAGNKTTESKSSPMARFGPKSQWFGCAKNESTEPWALRSHGTALAPGALIKILSLVPFGARLGETTWKCLRGFPNGLKRLLHHLHKEVPAWGCSDAGQTL